MAKTTSHAGQVQVPKRGISQQQEAVPASDALSSFGPNKTVRLDKKDFIQCDGCEAAAYIAYTCAENIFIFTRCAVNHSNVDALVHSCSMVWQKAK